MDRDGTRDGFDLPLTRTVADAVGVPVIASGRRIIACPGFVPSRKAALKVSWKIKKSSFVNDLGNPE